MVEFKLDWTEKSIKGYVKSTIFGKTFGQRFPIILFIFTVIAMFAAGIVLSVISGQYINLLLSLCAVLFAVILTVTYTYIVNKLTKQLVEANIENKELVAAVSEKTIIFLKNGTPCGGVDWDDVTDITDGESAFYITTKDSLLVVLEKELVVSGVLKEAEEVLAIKSAALTKGKKK